MMASTEIFLYKCMVQLLLFIYFIYISVNHRAVFEILCIVLLSHLKKGLEKGN